VDRVTSWFVPVIILCSLLTFVIWYWLGPAPSLSHALINAVAVMIIACPCAMGLATPTSIMVGTGRAAELGVLFRQGDALQRLRDVQVVAFDKTGTLTLGKPALTDFVVLDPIYDRALLLSWAAAMTVGYQNHNTKLNAYGKAVTSHLTMGESAYYSISQRYAEEGFSLNGTPTNTALIALMSLVPQFKKEKNLQVVNTIILTDGEAGDQPLTDQVKYEYGKAQPLIVIRDPKTRREYKTWKDIKPSREGGETYQNVFYAREQQSLLVAMLRDRTGAKVININLVTGTRAATFVIEAGVKTDEQRKTLKKQFTKEGWVSIPKTGGFDEVIALNTANATEAEFDFDAVTVSDTDSKAGQKELSKAFVKSLESRKGNRPLMARIAELISKNL
jgi:hypothetical protein